MRSTILLTLGLLIIVIAIVGGVLLYQPPQTPVTTGAGSESSQDETVAKDAMSPSPLPVQAFPSQADADQANAQEKPVSEPADPIAAAETAPTAPDLYDTPQLARGTVHGALVRNDWDPLVGNPLSGVEIRFQNQVVATTGDGGHFSFKTRVKTPEIFIDHPGYHPKQATLPDVSLPENSSGVLRIVLIPQGAIYGKVIDNGGRGVNQASVNIRSQDGRWAQMVNSNIEGHFFASNAPDSPVTLSAEQTGYADKGEGTLSVSPPFADEIILKLYQPLFSISGRVTRSDTGEGVQDAVIEARNLLALSSGTTQTDESGFYSLKNLSAGTYNVSLQVSQNLFIQTDQRDRTVRLLEREAANVDFELQTGVTLSGLVVDSSSSPVTGAYVYLTPEPRANQGYGIAQDFVRTGEGGTFSLSAPPSALDGDQTSLGAVHPELGSGISEPLTAESSSTQLIVRLDQSKATVNGRVVDSRGAPVEGAFVSANRSDPYRMTLASMVYMSDSADETNDQGEFSIAVTVLGEKPDAISGAPGYQAEYTVTAAIGHNEQTGRQSERIVQRTIELTPGETKTIELVLDDDQGVIQGRVMDETGQPVGRYVNVTAIHPRLGPVMETETDLNSAYRFGQAASQTGPSTYLPEGVYTLEFSAGASPRMHGTLYQVKTGTMNADIVLSAKKWHITGAVFDAETKETLHQYGVFVEHQPFAERAQPFVKAHDFNSHDGTYEITLHEPGTYRLRFYADGYQAQAGVMTVREESKEIQVMNVELQPQSGLGSIIGRYAAPEGTRLLRVEALGVGAFPVPGNEFIIEQLPPGEHDLLFYIIEEASQSIVPVGVLTAITVMPDAQTDIGAVSAANLQRFMPAR